MDNLFIIFVLRWMMLPWLSHTLSGKPKITVVSIFHVPVYVSFILVPLFLDLFSIGSHFLY